MRYPDEFRYKQNMQHQFSGLEIPVSESEPVFL